MLSLMLFTFYHIPTKKQGRKQGKGAFLTNRALGVHILVRRLSVPVQEGDHLFPQTGGVGG
ncbi:MAG: hypothetical protein PT958_06495, partial [Firmicutes bacterium]|nr:hypothetical protein [Bacillota bacterium]